MDSYEYMLEALILRIITHLSEKSTAQVSERLRTRSDLYKQISVT